MTKINELITKFKEFKEELNKNVNMSYAGSPNMASSGGSSMPSVAQKAEAGRPTKALFTDKPISPSEVSDVGASGFKVEPKQGQKIKQIDIPAPHIEDAKKAEVLKFDANGQWSLDKRETGHEKGTHTQSNMATEYEKKGHKRVGGVSEAGADYRSGDVSFARVKHKEVLADLKQMPSPKLPK